MLRDVMLAAFLKNRFTSRIILNHRYETSWQNRSVFNVGCGVVGGDQRGTEGKWSGAVPNTFDKCTFIAAQGEMNDLPQSRVAQIVYGQRVLWRGKLLRGAS